MSYYAISDSQLSTLRSAVGYRTGNYPNTWNGIIEALNMTCLKEGTQILMADGTTKNIEDVQAGDTLRSWDINTNQYIDVKCHCCIPTGRARNWLVHCFSDGSALWIYETHGIYNATAGFTVGSKDWKIGSNAILENGEQAGLTFVQPVTESEFKTRYAIISENSLYFADGVLCGHAPKDKITFYSQGLIPNCTPEEVEHFRALGQIYDKGRNSRMYNAEYRKESAPYFAQLSAARISEAEHQAALDASDYKNNKHAQGLIDDIEYAEFTVECNAHRDAINIAREEQKTALAEITAIKKKFKLGKKSIKKCFLEAYTLDMEFYHKNHPATEVAE